MLRTTKILSREVGAGAGLGFQNLEQEPQSEPDLVDFQSLEQEPESVPEPVGFPKPGDGADRLRNTLGLCLQLALMA